MESGLENYTGVEGEELSLAAGVLVGAQMGALISRHLAHRQELVARLFSVAMIGVALRLLAGVFL